MAGFFVMAVITFKDVRFPDEAWSYIAPTWEEMGRIYLDLGLRILNSPTRFDILVTLAKGGWTWARSMADILKIADMSSFQLMTYDPVLPGKKLDTVMLKSPLNTDLKNKKTLLFDDVNDTGDSLKFSMSYLKKFRPDSVITATLFHKPHSRFRPDFYGIATDAWIIFPHERREGITGLARKWKEKQISSKNIYKRLVEIGLPKKEVMVFLELEKIL